MRQPELRPGSASLVTWAPQPLPVCVTAPKLRTFAASFPTSLGRGSPLTTAPYRRGAPWGADHLTPEQAQVTEESHGSEPHEMMHVKVLCKQQAFVTVGVKVLCEQQAPHRLIRLSPVGQALPRRTSWLSDPGKSPPLSGTWFSYSGKGITSAPLLTAHESLE